MSKVTAFVIRPPFGLAKMVAMLDLTGLWVVARLLVLISGPLSIQMFIRRRPPTNCNPHPEISGMNRRTASLVLSRSGGQPSNWLEYP